MKKPHIWYALGMWFCATLENDGWVYRGQSPSSAYWKWHSGECHGSHWRVRSHA